MKNSKKLVEKLLKITLKSIFLVCLFISIFKKFSGVQGGCRPLEPPSKGRLKPRTSNIVVDICYFPLKSSIFRRFSMEKQLKLVQNLIKITLKSIFLMFLFISIFKKFLRRPGGLPPPGTPCQVPLEAYNVSN